MKLAFTDLGGAGSPPLVVLHGLLGSSRNWNTVGKRLAEYYHVLALDLRNHGQSAHAREASVATMAGDVLEFMDDHGLGSVHLMGHSLGGKVAMRLACDVPSRVDRLFVLDIAPKVYPADTTVLDAMRAIDLSRVTTRAQAEAELVEAIPSQAARWFVLTNLVREDDGFRWQVDLDILLAHVPLWTSTTLAPSDRYAGPTKFVIGGKSDYVSVEDVEEARAHFPHLALEIIEESGHNVHVQGGDAFLEAVTDQPRAGRTILAHD